MFRKAREILCKACSPVEFVILMLLVRRDTRRWRRHLAELREKYSLPVGELALVLGVLAVLVCTPASAIAGQSAEAALMRLSLDGACQLVGIPCDYESRYDLLLQLCKEGVVVFKSPDTG
ncbi:MAG: hypothetical protein U1A16_00425, partial [Patescibacteria group bacterium]|nr:hypothetical protein [Patescibacteria group bacterium]